MEARRRILVVEDDPETAGQIVDSLTANGYQVDIAVNGNDALNRGRSESYAVLTIDRMLPDFDGIAVMQQLRQDGIATPVLIVSALGEIDDRVRGLRAGGDDYLVKPFAFAELLARVEALARRSATVVRETVLRVGDLEADLVSRRGQQDGRKITLLPREFQLLEYSGPQRRSGRAARHASPACMGYTPPAIVSTTSLLLAREAFRCGAGKSAAPNGLRT